MARQGDKTKITLPLDGAPATPVAINRLVAMSGVNAGNALLATLALTGLIGITEEDSDSNGYAAIRISGVGQVVAGAGGVTAKDLLKSDANGKALTAAPAAAGAGTLTGIIGIALNTAAAGALVDVLIQPQNLYV